MVQKKIALTIAGSDSGGGAGIQADLKTFAALGVHGASAIACLTAQNPKRVLGIETVSPKMLRQQLEAVFDELNPRAAKTGMLFSEKNVSVVAGFFKRRKCPLVIDPILISTSGRQLIEQKALIILKAKLLPLATLVTPNLREAEIFSGQTISSLEEMAAAARKIYSQFGCVVLVKGGHTKNRSAALIKSGQLRGDGFATDVFFDGHITSYLSAPFIKGVRTHGTGCTYSAAICAALALGHDLPHAVGIGKKFITAAIADSYRIGNHFALGPLCRQF